MDLVSTWNILLKSYCIDGMEYIAEFWMMQIWGTLMMVCSGRSGILLWFILSTFTLDDNLLICSQRVFNNVNTAGLFHYCTAIYGALLSLIFLYLLHDNIWMANWYSSSTFLAPASCELIFVYKGACRNSLLCCCFQFQSWESHQAPLPWMRCLFLCASFFFFNIFIQRCILIKTEMTWIW